MRIRPADFAMDNAALRAVRFTVFVDEQRVPQSIEIDASDASCVHLLALDDDEHAIGTIRIDIAQSGKVGRLAVLSTHRRQGVGRALMKRIHAVAKDNDLDTVWCNAQVSALPFYRALGYRVISESFYEADIEHAKMECKL